MFRPEGGRKHSAQPGEAFDVPFEKGLQNNFGVTVSTELMSPMFQFRPQLPEVVDLALADAQSPAIGALHRLHPALKIDDLEPHGAQRDILSFVEAVLIRTAVPDALDGPAKHALRRRLPEVREPGDSAHWLFVP